MTNPLGAALMWALQVMDEPSTPNAAKHLSHLVGEIYDLREQLKILESKIQ